METFNGTATQPQRRMPNNATAISKLLSMSRATRSPACRPSDFSPLATLAVSRSNSRHVRRRAPSTSAVRAPRHFPCSASKSGSDRPGSRNQLIDARSLVVILHGRLICTRRAVEADLADIGEQSGARAAEVVACHAIPSIEQILAVEREAPRTAVGGKRQPRIEQGICRLVGDARSGVRHFGEAAPI